jgi:hypothetical protein
MFLPIVNQHSHYSTLIFANFGLPTYHFANARLYQRALLSVHFYINARLYPLTLHQLAIFISTHKYVNARI